MKNLVVNEEEGQVENEDMIMLKKANVVEGKDYGKLLGEKTIDGVEYIYFKKDKKKSGPSSKLKPIEELKEFIKNFQILVSSFHFLNYLSFQVIYHTQLVLSTQCVN